MQWYLSESTWDAERVNKRRVELVQQPPNLKPNGQGALVIDETGDRKDGHQTAHVGRQYLANLGKIDNGVVSVTSLWADERVYYPIDIEPYTPAAWFEQGKADPAFRTKLQIAVALVQQALEKKVAFRAVVADCFYGEDRGFRKGLEKLGVGYVLALKPSHGWRHPVNDLGAQEDIARAESWTSPEHPGQWRSILRAFRDGHTEPWWALEVSAGPYGPQHALRAVGVTSDPVHLPALNTWYLVTNLPAPHTPRATSSSLAVADLAEIIRLYALRAWVEHSYKQVKYSLGWAHYQVRTDVAIRRHWILVFCAFTFCWWQAALEVTLNPLPPDPALPLLNTLDSSLKKVPSRPLLSWPFLLRQVRAWLEPFILLKRYWIAFSSLPPPPPLQFFLDWLCLGHPLDLYASP